MADNKIVSTIYGPELKRDDERTGVLKRVRCDRIAAQVAFDSKVQQELESAGFLEAHRNFRESTESGDPKAAEAFELRHEELKAKYRPSDELIGLQKKYEEAVKTEIETRQRLLGPFHNAQAEWGRTIGPKAHELNGVMLGQDLLKGKMLREYARQLGLTVPDLPIDDETDRKKECARACRKYLQNFGPNPEHWLYLVDCLWRVEPAFEKLKADTVRNALKNARQNGGVSVLSRLSSVVNLNWTEDAIRQAEKR